MALVSYSESEGSDSESENVTKPPNEKPSAPTPSSNPPKPTPGANPPKTIVDRSNPRKIRVALPEIKPETAADGVDGPARKKARIGGGGGAFSGFNSFLPAPKRNATAEKAKASGPARKPFSLKTGAGPGFDREADEEMRREHAFNVSAEDGDETIPKAGSLQAESTETGSSNIPTQEKESEVKLRGNVMMFKPLSVGRNNQKKKQPPRATTTTPASSKVDKSKTPSQPSKEQVTASRALPALEPKKPKISLFSLSKEEPSTAITPDTPAQGTTYEPLVYHTDSTPAGPEPEPQTPTLPSAPTGGSSQTLGNVADDLNLSRAQRRHLFGRNSDLSNSQVFNFNTDAEYVANKQMLEHTDLAAAQHNPVRAIAPGKHTLQQLVSAASTQRDALEESFATGRRNKKEAGSKYGW